MTGCLHECECIECSCMGGQTGYKIRLDPWLSNDNLKTGFMKRYVLSHLQGETPSQNGLSVYTTKDLRKMIK